MALIKCPECGHEVSTLADRCPNCGMPIEAPKSEVEKELCQEVVPEKKPKNNTLAIVIAIFVILAAILGIYFLDTPSKSGGNGSEQFSSFQTHEDDAITGIECEICGQRDAVIEYGGYYMCKYCYEFVKYGKE